MCLLSYSWSSKVNSRPSIQNYFRGLTNIFFSTEFLYCTCVVLISFRAPVMFRDMGNVVDSLPLNISRIFLISFNNFMTCTCVIVPMPQLMFLYLLILNYWLNESYMCLSLCSWDLTSFHIIGQVFSTAVNDVMCY